MSMKDRRQQQQQQQQQNAWTAVAVRPPDQIAAHHHYISPPKWSPASQHQSQALSYSWQNTAKCGWPVFRNEHRPSLGSVSTDRAPLMLSEASSLSTRQYFSPESQLPFTDKYGRCLEILHYGSNSTVRLHQCETSFSDPKGGQLIAIKVYRHNILGSSNPLYHASCCSPTAIAHLHPHHPNILPITDLLSNERSEICLVMPYCAGGDLHELLSRTGPLPTPEADCIIAQILRALAFLHDHNTAHRDIRLETVLLTQNGAVKLAGFGDEHISRLWTECAVAAEAEEDALERSPSHSPASWSFSWMLSNFSRSSQPRRGSADSASSSASFPGISLPYVPPEGFHYRLHYRHRDGDEEDGGDDDPRPADVWAAGIIYLILITGRLPWRSARPEREDARYLEYLHCRGGDDGYPPIEALGQRRRSAIYAMLHPISRKRIRAINMLRSEWMDSVSVCEAGEKGL